MNWPTSWAHAIVSTALFPVMFVGCLVLAWGALALGAPPAVAVFAGYPTATACFIAERLVPVTQRWREGHGDVPTDIAHVVFSQLGGSTLAALIVGVIPLHLGAWPSHWPLVLQLVLAFVIYELCQYSWHRACHANGVLWRIHATHHSSPRMMWLSSARFHPIEVVLEYVLVYAPLAMLGASPAIVAMVSVATVTCSLLQHSNVEVKLGPLNWVFAGPELHRPHHGIEHPSQLVNYGSVLILWDVVFGTRRAPTVPQASLDVGLPGFPQTYVGQLLAPFRWKP